MSIKYLHTMVRVKDLETSMAFFQLLGLQETRRWENETGRFTLVFMAPPNQPECPVELTYNWDGDEGLPSDSRHFGHLAYEVDNIYETCQHLADNGVTINRPPRDGRMAFVRSPDNISVELLQAGDPLPPRNPGRAWRIPGIGEDPGRHMHARVPGGCPARPCTGPVPPGAVARARRLGLGR